MILGINTKYENRDLERYQSRGNNYLIMANTEWLDITLYKDDLKFVIPQSCINKNGRVNKYINDSIERLAMFVKLSKQEVRGSIVDKMKADNSLRKAITIEETYLSEKGVKISEVDGSYRESLVG